MSQDQAEEFLLHVIRSFILSREARPVPPPNLDWSRLAGCVAPCRVAPIFCSLVDKDAAPPHIVQEWESEWAYTLARNTRSLSTLVRISRILEEARLEVVILRGLSVALTAYGDISLRPTSDVDILARPADREAIIRVLASHGMRPERHRRCQTLFEVDELLLEFHWSLLTPRRFQKTIDSEQLISSRLPLDVAGGRIYRLPATMDLIVLVTHAFAHHRLSVMINLIDIALVSTRPDVDWEYLAKWSQAAPLTRMFFLTLTFVDRLFNLGLGQRLEVFGCPPKPAERIAEGYRARLLGNDSLVHFLLRKRGVLMAAEHPCAKLKQVIRFFAKDELDELCAAICTPPPMRLKHSAAKDAITENDKHLHAQNPP
ncbi:MAG TPA: nucleotidyltransferase family protein [Planctomycetota bacterium]|nr:nucleotidyltransferase family protein [Planctomycetota bacterium]